MQRLSIMLIACVIIGAMAWLYSNGIKAAITVEYEPPLKEHAPKVYAESHKIKRKRVICSRCHTDENAEFIKKIEGAEI